ncbi:MAG: hypothetical protein CVU39_25945 [Chloroflexi bacterium HGW-Chloroflexi-10]|nr:MAG: hypothetical protein CVU39_25945 [Chloroflexi bacterium HGW-Chloroflexi-10]
MIVRLGSGSISVLFSQNFCYNEDILFAWGEVMLIEALTINLVTQLIQRILEKGLDNVIDAGYKEAAQSLKSRLYGDKNQQHANQLQKILEKVANDERWCKPLSLVLKSTDFLTQVLTALLDLESDFNLEQMAEDWQQKFAGYPDMLPDLKKFFTTLKREISRDEYWGVLLADYQDLRDRKEIKEALAAKGYPGGEKELVQQVIQNFQFTFENNDIAVGVVNGDLQINYHQHLTTPDYEGERIQQAQSEARTIYLEHLIRTCNNLPLLTALGDDNGRYAHTDLQDIYIELNTTAFIETEDFPLFFSEDIDYVSEGSVIQKFKPKGKKELKREKTEWDEYKRTPIRARDAARKHLHLVLLGEAGSGKSSFAKYLLAHFATAQLKAGALLEGFDTSLLPLLLNLREVSHSLFQINTDNLSEVDYQTTLVRVLRDAVKERACAEDCVKLEKEFNQCWRKGTVFLVLDGLDEVPEEQRSVVRLAVAALREQVQPKRLLITCRNRSYTESAVIIGVPACQLAELTEEQIHGFIQAWYRHQHNLNKISKDFADARIKNLQSEALKPSLFELSQNPLLLTTMALIHQRDTELPNQRVKLYKEAVELLVRRWQRIQINRLAPSEELSEFLKDDQRVYPLLERLAYETHRGKDGNLPKAQALDILLEESFPQNWDLAREFLNYVDQRSGLLVGHGSEPGKPGSYGFPHRTFQEYLAGCYLAGREDLFELLHQLAGQDDRWTLPVHFAFEELYYHERRGKTVLYGLALQLNQEFTREDDIAAQRKLLWAAYITALLGCDYIEKMESFDGRRFLDSLRQRLPQTFGKALTRREWAEAGDLLTEIGDPRFYGPELGCLPKEDLLGFVRIPPGVFWMGSDPKTDKGSHKDEQKQHQVDLPEYYLSRYLVTVDQFRVFTERSGYKKFDPDALKDPGSRPVRYVTWYDALAYCDWLQTQLLDWHETVQDTQEKLTQGWRVPITGILAADEAVLAICAKLQQGWCITLPSEAEWEKAARGSGKSIYPWGDAFDSRKANGEETMIGTTSVVGCFPLQGEFGLHDLSGNLWEWTRSKHKTYPYQKDDWREDLVGKEERVLRGGAFFSDEIDLRLASRFRDLPNFESNDLGFRVVLSPFPSDR